MPNCTYFCQQLNLVTLRDGLLPTHEDLVSHFELTSSDEESRWSLGQWKDIQLRDNCSFCRLVAAAIIQEIQSEHHSHVLKPNQLIDVIIFPGESAFRISYPSRLGTQIAFVAEREEQASSPDNAKRFKAKPLDHTKIQGWIEKCNEGHAACVRHGKNKTQFDSDDAPREGSFKEASISNFRVLDLKTDCVRRVALDVRYITLSYVWGQTPTVLLQHDNKHILTTPGGLTKIRSRLPRTINDAIDFSKTLGERYLWVDALCLLQDDASDMELGVSMMHSIYQGSYLNIIAASGSDATAGIPKLTSGGSSGPQIVTILRFGLRMTIIRSIDWHLARSEYSQRGWTLQELVLPPRSLIFINDRAYFRCQQSNWSEETWADKWMEWLDADDSNISRVPEWSEGRVASLWAYQKLCEDYSLRKLRNDGDAIRAMAGVTRQLFAGMKTSSLEGLPAYYLDTFLLFSSSNANMRRRSEFASFSWAGWEGRIMFPRENYSLYEDGREDWQTTNILKWLRDNRLVDWKLLTTNAESQYLSSFKTTDKVPIHNFKQLFPGVSWRESEEPRSPHGNSDYADFSTWAFRVPDWDTKGMTEDWTSVNDVLGALGAADGQAEYERIIQNVNETRMVFTMRNWLASRTARAHKLRVQDANPKKTSPRTDRLESFNYRFRSARLGPDSPEERLEKDRRIEARNSLLKRANPELSDEDLQQLPTPRFPPFAILEFQTVSLHLTLGEIPAYASWVTEKRTVPVCFDRVPAIQLHGRTGSISGWLHPDNAELLPKPGCDIELIVISRCQTPTIASASHEKLFAQGIHEAPASAPWKLLWVLYIVWIDGIAERRGVGQVVEAALADAVEPLPGLKTIRLG